MRALRSVRGGAVVLAVCALATACASSDGGEDAGPRVDPLCTSQKTWGRGDQGTPIMHPGRACLTCHAEKRGPDLTAAGTVFPTLSDPDDCNGLEGVTVILTGADGKEVRATTNSAGNFFFQGAIAMPYRARIVGPDGAEQRMPDPQTTGDCNSCHTQSGANGTSGRIKLP